MIPLFVAKRMPYLILENVVTLPKVKRAATLYINSARAALFDSTRAVQ